MLIFLHERINHVLDQHFSVRAEIVPCKPKGCLSWSQVKNHMNGSPEHKTRHQLVGWEVGWKWLQKESRTLVRNRWRKVGLEKWKSIILRWRHSSIAGVSTWDTWYPSLSPSSRWPFRTVVVLVALSISWPKHQECQLSFTLLGWVIKGWSDSTAG